MVPSEYTLVKQHGVARGTVRAALAALLEKGLIEVVPGQGLWVVGPAERRTPPPPVSPPI
jgi:DNA-binding GntR family transcriptional regulator